MQITTAVGNLKIQLPHHFQITTFYSTPPHLFRGKGKITTSGKTAFVIVGCLVKQAYFVELSNHCVNAVIKALAHLMKSKWGLRNKH